MGPYSVSPDLSAWPQAMIAARRRPMARAQSAPAFTRKPPASTVAGGRVISARRPAAVQFVRPVPRYIPRARAIVDDYPELGEYPEMPIDLGLSFKSIGRSISKAVKGIEKKVTRPIGKFAKKAAPIAAAALPFVAGPVGVVAGGLLAKAGGVAKKIAPVIGFKKKVSPLINVAQAALAPTGAPVAPASTNGATAAPAPAPEKSITERVAAEVRRFNQRRLRLQEKAQGVLDTGQQFLNQAGVYGAAAGGAVQGAVEGAERGAYEAGAVETARQTGTQLPGWVIPAFIAVGAFALIRGGGSRSW